MRKLPEIFQEKQQTFSFELFPPKTEQGYANLVETIAQLAQLQPDFISCTYGAGGGNRDKTLDISQHIQDTHNIPALAHLTCVLNTQSQIQAILDDIIQRGLRNILALRGDPPAENPHWMPGPQNFHYSYELCRFIRQHDGESLGIGVAGFPEGHPASSTIERDAAYLKNKLQNGADFVITQIFLDNQYYFHYVRRLMDIGVAARIIPGILPISNYRRLKEFAMKDKITIPQRVKDIFEPIQDDPEKTLEAGKAFAIEQCRDLLQGGAPGIHFYALNKYQPVADILQIIRPPFTQQP